MNEASIGRLASPSRTDEVGRAKMAKARRNAPATSKTEIVVKKLRLAKGVTVQQLIDATGWQAHSVRGFLSRTIKKKLRLSLASEVGKDGVRRYRIVGGARAA